MPPPLADFLEEVHSYLDRSILLLSTEDGEVRTGGSGGGLPGGHGPLGTCSAPMMTAWPFRKTWRTWSDV